MRREMVRVSERGVYILLGVIYVSIVDRRCGPSAFWANVVSPLT